MHKGTCLVLGANGFIGSHVVDELVGIGYRVTAFDHFRHKPQFRADQSIRIVSGDATSINDVRSALAGANYLIHAFSATTPATSDADPYTDISANLNNSVHIFEECVKAKLKKIVFISSGGVIYGESGKLKKAKESDPAMPVSPYGINKLAIELYLKYFERKYGMNHITYRLSNPYGPRQITKHSQGVVPAFINQTTSGESISIYGDGTSTRDYIYIKDAARMIVASFAKDNQHDIYNLGSGVQISLIELLSAVQAAIGAITPVKYLEAPQTFLHSSEIDVRRLEDEFGLSADTSLRDGIKWTVEAATENKA